MCYFCKLSSQHQSAAPRVSTGRKIQGMEFLDRQLCGAIWTQKQNSEAEGGNERSPICPLGPSSRLLPRSHFPSDIWLDTFQGRAHILGFGVCAVLGHYGFPPPTPGPACIWCSWKKVLEWVTRAGRSHTRHTMTWPQTRRLRYKDKYKYYSQNLCINKYFWGLLDHFIFWKIVSRTVKAYPKVFSLTG